jgi:hypothetical protein
MWWQMITTDKTAGNAYARSVDPAGGDAFTDDTGLRPSGSSDEVPTAWYCCGPVVVSNEVTPPGSVAVSFGAREDFIGSETAFLLSEGWELIPNEAAP